MGGRAEEESNAAKLESSDGQLPTRPVADFSAFIINDYAAPPPVEVPDYAAERDREGGSHPRGGAGGGGGGQVNSQSVSSASVQKSMYWNYVRFKRHAANDIWRDFEEMSAFDQVPW